MDLSSNTVLVTGGASGIGLAFAERFLAAGSQVLICGRREERKAAFRSYTLSLRRQLRDTPIRVVEVLPPAVDTDLGGPGLHTFGVPIGEFADYAFARLAEGDEEIAYGFAREALTATPSERAAIFDRMNR